MHQWDRNRGELVIAGQVKQLRAITAPGGPGSPFCRDSDLLAGAVEGPYVYLGFARLVGNIRYPAPVRREAGVRFIEAGAQE